MKRMKTTLLTLCLATALAVIAKWTPLLVSADTTAVVCGQVLNFTPPTATTGGSIRINSTVYSIAPGVTIVGQPILLLGANVCLDLTFNGSNEIISPSKITGTTVNVCGGVNSFTPATPQTQGAISIGSSSYAIAAGVTIGNQGLISPGSNMCLTATLNAANQITNPSVIQVNLTSPIIACGNVSNYQAASSGNPGSLSIGGLNFTIGAGVDLGTVSVGSNRCLEGVLDINGQLIAPSSIVGNTGGGSKVCGGVTSFQQAFGGVAGWITIGGVTVPISPGLDLPGQNAIAPGSNVCISPMVLNGGYISGGSAISAGNTGCLQFSAPVLTHGLVNGQDETFLLPKPMVFSVLSGPANVGVFNVNMSTFGSFPQINGTSPSGVVAMASNVTVHATTCLESFWDLVFEIATKGSTEGDMITVSVQNPNGTGVQILGMFTVQNGGVIVNQLHPSISMLVNGNGPYGAGTFIPMMGSAGASGLRTGPITFIFSMDMHSPIMGCFAMGVDIKRMGGAGMTSFVPHFVVAMRKGDEQEGNGMQSGLPGTFPTGLLCGVVCNGCFQQPPPSTPTPTPTPTPTASPTEEPTPTPPPTPTPTPPPMPIKCDTICFRNSTFFLLRLDFLPSGSILIGGVNLNNPVSILRNKDQIRLALQGGVGPVQKLNQQFVATQLSLANAGGTGSPVVFNTFWSKLRCSGIDFQPVTLSNGVVLSPDSLLDTLVTQATLAIKQNRTVDMVAIANILALLNQRC